MADITDGSQIAFCNNKVRPLCDAAAKLSALAADFQNEWNAQNYGSIFTSGGSGLVQDGSPADGRLQMTQDNVYAIAELAGQIQTLLNGSSNQWLNVALKGAVNTLP